MQTRSLFHIKQLGKMVLTVLCLGIPMSVFASQLATPEWIQAGWAQIDLQNPESALDRWQTGIKALPDLQLLAAVGAFSSFANAVEHVKKIGREHNAFFVQANLNGKLLYFALAAETVPRDIISRQNTLAALKIRAGIKGLLLATEAARFKSNAITEPVQKVATAGQQLHKSAVVEDTEAITATRRNVEQEKNSSDSENTPLTANAISFTINSFDVSGNTLVSIDQILIGLRDYYGSDITLSELDYIREDIVNMYHLSGYQGVDVKIPQQIGDDTITILISEDTVTAANTRARK